MQDKMEETSGGMAGMPACPMTCCLLVDNRGVPVTCDLRDLLPLGDSVQGRGEFPGYGVMHCSAH